MNRRAVRPRRGRSRFIVPALLAGLASMALAATGTTAASADDRVPGTAPGGGPARMQLFAAEEPTPDGLQMVVNERGRISRSISGAGFNADSGVLHVEKPAGATVRRAYLSYATTGFTGYQLDAPLTLAGSDVPITHEVANGISSYNYFSDVTDIVRPVVDSSAPGRVSLSVTEPWSYGVDGEVLVVVFDDPAVQHDQSVSILYGALSPAGDKYRVNLTAPIDLSDPATRLEMSLGISFSYQTGGSQQYSYVNVNGVPMAGAAGGEDDGEPSNGALLTVGGDGDSPDDPADPLATPTHPRSDDELYDLSPFVRTGDKSIQVDTVNPSMDDNVFLATFTMNPPVSSIKDAKRKLVQVSLGDSYQSGEGAGSAFPDAESYLAQAYEDGSNFPDSDIPQLDTLTPQASSGGDGCHRGLHNYPKQVADWALDDNDVTLVDVTCSGAKIESGGKPAIVGDVNDQYQPDPGSQVDQALQRLAELGLDRTDVDVITVGAGGNDAKFGDLVTACLIPSLAKKLVAAYPDPPGGISFLVNHLLTCSRYDSLVSKAKDAVGQLAPKERYAQITLRNVFPNADIVQLDYPGILPEPDAAPSWCGGIGRDDIDYASEQAGRINDIIRGTVQEAHDYSAGLDRRHDLVEVASAFGGNALCPSDPSASLANGIDEATFDEELTRLLADPELRPELDEVVSAWKDYWACVRNVPFCNPKTDRIKAAVSALMTSMGARQDEILANMTKSPTSGEPQGVRYDRSRGLFHPNQSGIDVLACYVSNTINYLGTYQCPNGEGAGFAPRRSALAAVPTTTPLAPEDVAGPGQPYDIALGGFQPGATISATFDGDPLATATVGVDGAVRQRVTLPDAGAGVHEIELRGAGATGVDYGLDLRVRYPGRPVGGEDYTTYLCCFAPRPDQVTADYEAEDIEISFQGHELFTTHADSDGGVLVTVPIPTYLPDGNRVRISLRGLTSGRMLTSTVDVVPYTPSLWATGADGVSISGARSAVDGLVHSEGGLAIAGAGGALTGGAEYVDRLEVSGAGVRVDPAAEKVVAGSRVRQLGVAAFRPDGSRARAAGSSYRAVPVSRCDGGVWRPTAAELTGVVYAPCGVAIQGRDLDRTVTIAAEGPVAVSGSSPALHASDATGALLVSGSTVTVGGGSVLLDGTVFAAGAVELSGSNATSHCGIVARGISVSGSGFTGTVDRACARD